MITGLTIPTTFVGNGSATVGTYGFPIQFATDLQLAQIDNVGNLTYLTSGFTVQGVGDPNSSNWTFTLTTPLPSGYTIYAYPSIPLNQNNQFSQQAGQVLQTTEKTFDRIVVMLGQLSYQLSLAFTVNPGTTPTPAVFYSQLATAVSSSQASATAAAASATAAAASAASVLNTLGFKNRLINGNFDVWQRGTSFSSIGAAVSSCYTADRWCAQRNGGTNTNLTVSRIAAPYNAIGALFGAKIQRTAGDTATTVINLAQMIAPENMAPILGKTVVLSYQVKVGANFSGFLNAYIWYGDGTNTNNLLNGTGWTLAASNSPSTNTNYQQFTLTATIPSTAKMAAVVFNYTPSGTAGADDSFSLLQVQLEPSTAGASGFDFRPIEIEKPMCYRYFWRQGGQANYQVHGIGVATGTNQVDVAFTSPVGFRSSPSIVTATTNLFTFFGAITSQPSAIIIVDGAADIVTHKIRCTSTATTGQAGMFTSNNSTAATIDFIAEL